MTAIAHPETVPIVAASTPTVALKRRTIDSVLIGVGAVITVVMFVAGGLLMWGSNFAEDYVHDQLAAVRRDERRAQDPGLDQPRPGGRIALTDERPAGPDDGEGEWFDDGHRA